MRSMEIGPYPSTFFCGCGRRWARKGIIKVWSFVVQKAPSTTKATRITRESQICAVLVFVVPGDFKAAALAPKSEDN